MTPSWVVSILCAMLVWLPACMTSGSGNGVGQKTEPLLPTAGREAYQPERERMVEVQLRGRGIRDERVLEAMGRVPRHQFVSPAYAPHAYDDRALPIGYEQTISQPYVVAYMTEAADIAPTDRVLEVGTGSGYQAAVLAEIAREVYTIEILPELAERAANALSRAGYENVHTRTGNGWAGWPEHAPFDAILVTAAPDEIPKALVDQLAVNGRMVVPVGKAIQEMVILTRTKSGVVEKRTIPVRFVPMTGKPKQ